MTQSKLMVSIEKNSFWMLTHHTELYECSSDDLKIKIAGFYKPWCHAQAIIKTAFEGKQILNIKYYPNFIHSREHHACEAVVSEFNLKQLDDKTIAYIGELVEFKRVLKNHV